MRRNKRRGRRSKTEDKNEIQRKTQRKKKEKEIRSKEREHRNRRLTQQGAFSISPLPPMSCQDRGRPWQLRGRPCQVVLNLACPRPLSSPPPRPPCHTGCMPSALTSECAVVRPRHTPASSWGVCVCGGGSNCLLFVCLFLFFVWQLFVVLFY